MDALDEAAVLLIEVDRLLHRHFATFLLDVAAGILPIGDLAEQRVRLLLSLGNCERAETPYGSEPAGSGPTAPPSGSGQ